MKLNAEIRRNLKLKIDYNNMMADFIGKEHGFTDREFNNFSSLVAKAFEEVKSNRGKDMLGWTELPYNQNDVVKDVILTAKKIKRNFDNFVVLGIGGSALGPMAVFHALCHLRHNELPRSKRKFPKFYVEDNVDPERMASLLDVIDLDKTIFNVVTKSGSTSETMSQYLIIMDLLKKKFGSKASEHIIATTSENKGNLVNIAKQEGIKTFYIPEGVGGRYSVLSPVGLLSSAVVGIDIKAMLNGAAYMDKLCSTKNIKKNPALMCALLQYLSIKRGKNISIMMPYADNLSFVADWYCQLWGESLGKARDNDGKLVYTGQTPVRALGSTDQHSQMQLYMEGPYDKVITFIGVEKFKRDVNISDGCKDFPDVNFLCGHTMEELIGVERLSAEYSLSIANRPNFTILLPEINAFTIGELLYMFELETAYCGSMLNLDAFNQPGVEKGKVATYAFLGKKGYEKEKIELNKFISNKGIYILK